MLVLSRKKNESIVIDDQIVVTVIEEIKISNLDAVTYLNSKELVTVIHAQPIGFSIDDKLFFC